jgi:glycine/D-amino acid oxidase-like deaminating enzyme
MKRRDLMRALALAPLVPALGAGCATPRVPDGDLIDPGMALGHRLRDLDVRTLPSTALPAPPADAPILDVIIAGGGVAGLAAAWRLRARGVDALEVIELADVDGGTARSGSSTVSAYPWGAHYVTAPLAEDTLTTSLLNEVGALEGVDALGHPIASETFACRDPDERLFVDGHFFDSLTPHELLDHDDRRDFARFEALVDHYGVLVDAQGRPAFALPRARCSTDAEVLGLDRMSFRDWLLAHDLVSPHLHWLCDYAVRDDDGVSLDEASAWAGLFYFCARRRPGMGERPVITQPDGNGFLVKHLARASEGRRTLNEAVVDVTQAGDDVVHVVTMDGSGTLRTRRARHVIIATPRFVAARVVRALRDAPPPWLAHFTTSAWVVCNVHLSERPRVAHESGATFAWDTVLYDSDSLGFVDATHQTGRDHGPTVWTWYRPLLGDGARARLYATDRAHWADVCLRDLARAFPDVRERATRVDVCRWGHAMVRPTVGLFTSGALERAAAPIGGRIHFAHTDLSGMALFEEALHHGVRAADAARETLA